MNNGSCSSRTRYRHFVTAAVVAGATCSGCSSRTPSVPPSMEVSHLRPSVRGTFFFSEPGFKLTATSLTTGLTRLVLAPDRSRRVASVSGPDAEGTVAYLTLDKVGSETSLRTARLDGTQDRLLVRRASTGSGWHPIALAPTGRRIACQAECSTVQMHAPKALLEEGVLEVWDTRSRQRSVPGARVLSMGMSWFPDGERLAVVRLVSSTEAPQLDEQPDGFGAEFRAWPTVPVVCIVDLRSGQSEMLHIGWLPVVSEDGACVLVEDFQQRLRRVDVKSRTSSVTTLPGKIGSVLSLQRDHLAVYWGLPTEEDPLRRAPMYSPVGGRPVLVSIRAAFLNSSQSQALVRHLDPRRPASVGPSSLRSGAKD